MTIRVGVTGNYFDDFSDPGVSIDKLAIDYALIPSRSYSKFSSEFFYSQNRRRLAIRVFYQ
ncbi:Major sperm protein [Caenorhabditis elegans]|nr:Major sperm protein [Caenorhabditis elegans]CDR32655.1 Major sperm protein [Caenorhabditis elegans]|eukprot:NP_001293287.1 Major sperm protein [Caenorhabditis elegans]